MKRLLPAVYTATIAFPLSIGLAGAADLPARSPPPILTAVPLFTWTGFYVGANAGYGWSTKSGNNQVVFGTATPVFFGSRGSQGGFTGGGQIGYNYQLVPGTGLVVGVETDIQYANIGGHQNFSSGSNGNYFGTVRGRLGYAFDRVLVYGTGGFAYGDIGGNGVLLTSPTGTIVTSGSRSNGNETGYTVGGGVEYAFTNNLTAKVEGLYVSLNGGNKAVAVATPVAFSTGRGREEFGVVRAGLNYKF